MELATTYICVRDMRRALDFYRALLRTEPSYVNGDRWITFDCGLSLFDRHHDDSLIGKTATELYNQAYADSYHLDRGAPKNNVVVFNFVTEDLRGEHDRLSALGIGPVSELMYVNVHMPYWHFTMEDPDGNLLEISEKG